MLSPQERQLFETIARNQPRFREWLSSQLEKQTEILVVAIDERQIRQAQGNASCLKQLIANLDLHLTSR